ncbi:GNAT family N-acetyltransferase [Pseudodonghicola flavimaris]|uniref:N-acetyltransferase family protein n=1 Tax=Pseudodonghicola flavimaris TaxID=3050036 RepID=A0ABT7F0G3_9RHOB|nr:GNAT family N-acetyltransferase [Pseudodonghicola flavimaris]MDK3018101.1 N-acetyltransferase family protein [Pseudodonghicola flavimaris]
MIVRAATAADAAAICAIANPIIRDTVITFNSIEKTPEGVAEEIAAKAPAFLVAEAETGTGSRVLGFASYTQFRGGAGYVHSMEHTIQLAPEARGQGAGRALIAGLEEIGRARGVHVLVAGVSAGNPMGLAFHAALGFVEVGRMPEVGFKFGEWLDLVLMQKILRPAS